MRIDLILTILIGSVLTVSMTHTAQARTPTFKKECKKTCKKKIQACSEENKSYCQAFKRACSKISFRKPTNCKKRNFKACLEGKGKVLPCCAKNKKKFNPLKAKVRKVCEKASKCELSCVKKRIKKFKKDEIKKKKKRKPSSDFVTEDKKSREIAREKARKKSCEGVQCRAEQRCLGADKREIITQKDGRKKEIFKPAKGSCVCKSPCHLFRPVNNKCVPVCQRGEKCTIEQVCNSFDATCGDQPRCNGKVPRTRRGKFVGRTD